MNYYLYISQSKVDMILPSIPLVAQKKITSELGVDVKIFKAIRKEERIALDTDVERLEVAKNYILASMKHGKLAEPQSWIYDTAEVSFHAFDENPDVVFYAGETDSTLFALGGSQYHLVGDQRAASSVKSMSHMQRLLDALGKRLSFPDPGGEGDAHVAEYLGKRVAGGARAWVTPVREMAGDTSSPKQKVRFLAKTLITERVKWDDRLHVLATPLFVELVD